ncbi:MAG: hypothetical protein JWO53_294, partial [Chlamydiia bacterium]|nr:hypothetical protein [Chlamydiia bacterium]
MVHIGAAGVLPKATYQGDEYYYFGVDKRNEITTFCGKKDKGEKNRACAAREFMEESLGAIASEKKIKKILEKSKGVLRIENLAAKQITYIVNLKLKENPMEKFDKKIKKKGLKKHQKEMEKIIAMKASTLKNL